MQLEQSTTNLSTTVDTEDTGFNPKELGFFLCVPRVLCGGACNFSLSFQ